jgi:hypothetical protein
MTEKYEIAREHIVRTLNTLIGLLPDAEKTKVIASSGPQLRCGSPTPRRTSFSSPEKLHLTEMTLTGKCLLDKYVEELS